MTEGVAEEERRDMERFAKQRSEEATQLIFRRMKALHVQCSIRGMDPRRMVICVDYSRAEVSHHAMISLVFHFRALLHHSNPHRA